MKQRFIRAVALVLLICLLPPLPAAAQEEAVQAQDISDQTTLTANNYQMYLFLFDKDIDTYYSILDTTELTLENDLGMGSLYIMFDLEYGPYTIINNDTGARYTAGSKNFLHEYIDLVSIFGAPCKSVTVCFDNGRARVSELFIFSEGEAPDFVQTWDAPHDGGADIVLFVAHGDDDHLYFAGLLPYYAKARGLRVQVVYLTDHRTHTYERTHEMLNGLWAVGVRAYPVFGPFPDFRAGNDELCTSYAIFENLGYSAEELLGYAVENIRRFKPLVAVGHDINGEYGNDQHKLYCDILMKAIEISQDPNQYPESASKYGTWDVPKTYLHLYKENPIVIDYDTPLEAFDGLTAFQVTQKYGYPCHKSQLQYGMFRSWLYGYNKEITKASQIKEYSPCEFGLYRSTVGEDKLKNDFMENVISYDEQARLEAERLEAERLEAERLEAERLEHERLEAERLAAEALALKQQTLLICCTVAAVILLCLAIALTLRKRTRRKA